MADLTIAVVGAGIIGRTHIETLARTEGMTLGAVVDPGLPGDAAFGVPIRAALSDLRGIDAVVIAAPNDLHRPLLEEAMSLGLPVLLEKPVANDLGDGRAMIAAAQAAGVPVLVGHHRRHNAIIARARQAIAGGELGELVTATVISTLTKPDAYFDVAWRRDPRSGGPLSINLIHEVDLLRHFWGEVAEVRALVSNAGRGAPVEDAAGAILSFAGGGLATLTLTDRGAGPWAWDVTAGENLARFPAHPAEAHFYSGTKAALSLPGLALWRHPGTPDWTQPMTAQTLAYTPNDPYVAQLAHFGAVVRGEADPAITLADGVANMAVIDAIKRSGASGAPVQPERVT
ncbi:Gfo/Idh/MocA family protein [Mesobacterium pallidum]|uniref:Gfo/Idh/MocA family protein n=1 Tax=Mesobacterium pallidum TaxID=2872037 RepID=UPI001EE18E51|nr:Gfo/Idh/MocA family oxidoreductase [Mesobacterium pallidum]